MNKPLRFILVVMFMSLCVTLDAQIQTKPRQASQSPQSQRQIDEQLAMNFYNNKEYDKAADLYIKLFEESNYYHHLSRYIDCQIFTGEFKEAEKALKSFIKNDHSTNKWRAQVDLAYLYSKDNESDRSEKLLKKIIAEAPQTRSSYTQLANMMRNRGFNEHAIMLYDKGATIPEMKSKFYMEKGITYQSMLVFDKATENYLLHLEIDPDAYDVVKSRISFMLRYDVDNSVFDDVRMALLKKAQENPDNVLFAELLVWYALQVQDYEIALDQEIAIDRRYDDREYDIIYLAMIAKDNEQFDVAIRAYEYLVKKSSEGAFYSEAVVGLTEVQYLKAELENITDVDFYSAMEERIAAECNNLGINDKTIHIVIIRAEILSFRLGRTAEAVSMLNEILTYNISKYNMAKVKMMLADVYLYDEEIWEATLLYSQVDKSMKEEPMGHEARLKNAQLRYYIGEFDWALSVLNILKSATSKLIANDAMTLSLMISDNLEYDTVALRRLAKADYYIYQKRYELANQMLDSVNMYNPNEVSMPYLLSRKAQIAMDNKDYELADSLYKRVYQGYAGSYIADKALLDDAVLLEKHLGKKEEAMECYAKLIDEYTASVYVAQARNAYRRLREK